MQYPIENFFRPAVEYIPAVTSSAGALVILLGSDWLFLPKELAIAGSGLLRCV